MADEKTKIITVDGTIRGKQRPRLTRAGIAYTPQQTVNYENWIKLCYQNQQGGYFGSEPLTMSIIAYYKIPKSFSKKKTELCTTGHSFPTKKPDADNIGKVIADSLNKLAYEDDSQIACMHIEKLWTLGNERVEFCISAMPV